MSGVTVTVTDPRHPLFGQRLRLLSLTCGRGPAFVAVALADGRRRLLRRAETDLERPLAPEAALPRISARALLPLAQHIRSMLAVSRQEASHAEPPHPARHDRPASTSPPRSRRRPGPMLPVATRAQLARQLAWVLRRVRDREADHADPAR
ncbi:hypothetical protein ACFQU7_37565 [Pseudoroseomonas wenyumeiae]